MLVLVEGGKPENSERKTLVTRREPTFNSTYSDDVNGPKSKPGYIDGIIWFYKLG